MSKVINYTARAVVDGNEMVCVDTTTPTAVDEDTTITVVVDPTMAVVEPMVVVAFPSHLIRQNQCATYAEWGIIRQRIVMLGVLSS